MAVRFEFPDREPVELSEEEAKKTFQLYSRMIEKWTEEHIGFLTHDGQG